MTLRTLNYGNFGIFLIMGNAGFCPSAVTPPVLHVKANMCYGRRLGARGFGSFTLLGGSAKT